ncbi:unnamed protein product [Adineta ricciae]|uniref:Uncharacterized protein n=1 Tax=Adineta ricciae TaxID=249248 RepID=A0A813QHL8_ADIRI|nr:unnamed protein product [Adineta ricciae]CAF1283348.1 unnamed protein product [Adineta ricciae]
MKSSKYIPKNEDVYIDISDQRYQKQTSLARNKKRRDRLEKIHLFDCQERQTKAQKRRDLNAECHSNYSMQVCDRFTCSDDRSEDYAVKFLNKYRHLNTRLLKIEALYVIRHNDTGFLDFILRHPRMEHQAHEYKGYRRHTILTYAICLRKSECVQVILEHVFMRQTYSTIIDYVCTNGRTALWYACQNGDFDLVRALVERGYATVNKCGVLIVASQNGHRKIVDYLLRKGCDPNRQAKNYNETALHAASRRNHAEIVQKLLAYGANANAFDYMKRTAIDYAIHKRHNEVAKILIRHQNGHFIMSRTGFTPLMLATYRNNQAIVDILTDVISNEQVLDEMTLLACNYIIDGDGRKSDVAYCYFEKALSRNQCSKIETSAPCEAYEFLHECRTLDELASIRDNENKFRMYALMVGERLLLKMNGINHFLTLLIKQSNVYKRQKMLRRSLQLRLHGYRLIMKFNQCTHKKYLSELIDLLYDILENKEDISIQSLTIIWMGILNEKNKIQTIYLFRLLFLMTYLIESKSVDDNGQSVLQYFIHQALYRNIIIENEYPLFSYLITRIVEGEHIYTYSFLSVPVLSCIRVLIDSGVDVNEIVSSTKSTPLHLIAQCSNIDHARSVIRLLLEANAHLDYVNRNGLKAEQLACDWEIRDLLRINRKLSLKCQCAHLVNSRNLNYSHYLCPRLIKFVQMHTI